MACARCFVWPKCCHRSHHRVGCIFFSIATWITLVTVLLVVAASSGPWPSRSPDPDWPSTLQYGIRWFSKGNIRTPGYDSLPPLQNAPSIILVHGWQPGTGQSGTQTSKTMVNFDYMRLDSKYGIEADLADPWIDQGWNVGIFYWTALADEPDVADAQDKIWSIHGNQGMRYRLNDQFYDSGLNVTIADLFVASYLKVFSNATWAQNPIRLLGHSLGSQVVCRAATMLAERLNSSELPDHLFPSQVVLLDPYMDLKAKSYLGTTVGTKVNANWDYVLASRLKPTLSIFQSSDIDFISGNGNSAEYTELVKKAAMVRVHPYWINKMDLGKLGNQHVSALAIYMRSFLRDKAPSARASDNEMAQLMGTGLIEQTDGGDTFDALDDTFTTTSWDTYGNYTGPSLAAFIMVIVSMIMMGLVALMICCYCGCCAYRHRCKCHRVINSDDIQQPFTYQASRFV